MLDVPPGSDAPLSCLLLGGEHALSFPGPGPFFFPPAHPFSFPTHPGFFPSPRIHPLVQQKPSSAPIHAVPPSLLYLYSPSYRFASPLPSTRRYTRSRKTNSSLCSHTPIFNTSNLFIEQIFSLEKSSFFKHAFAVVFFPLLLSQKHCPF